MLKDNDGVDLFKYLLDVYDALTDDDYCAEQMVREINILTGRALRDIASNGKV